ncbi:MAG: transaldolase [Anaerolineae bacterium]|jgi:transaldolase/glucose-6-phosphate isomerase|nr:transaldolase [Anaerolineae bacterium]
MNRLKELQQLGQSIWLDFISREALRSGELAARIESGVLGMTSNPAIFEKSMGSGNAYDEDIQKLARLDRSTLEIYEALALEDIAAAAALLKPIYDQTAALDGYVSIEVSPRLAHDTAGTIAEARRLWKALDRPNIMIKIPGTPEGVPAIRMAIADGINVNVTLLFSIEAYEASALAYIEGLEARAARGEDVSQVASVASFFVSRVDTLVDAKLTHHNDAQGNPEAAELRGKAAIANARLAYERFEQLFSGPRWEALAAKGARPQRPLWASTSTKDPSYPDTIYMDALIGPHTVNTAPPQTIEAFADHGVVATTVTEGVDEARATLQQLEALGIRMDDVTAELLKDGVRLFAEAFDRLESGLAKKVAALSASLS